MSQEKNVEEALDNVVLAKAALEELARIGEEGPELEEAMQLLAKSRSRSPRSSTRREGIALRGTEATQR